MSKPIYVRNSKGIKFIATTQMIRRIETGELFVCEPPTAEEIAASRSRNQRRTERTATMLEKMPEKVAPAQQEVPAEQVSAIAAQIKAFEDSAAAGAPVQTDEEADAELREVMAKTAALKAAVASGQVVLQDPKTVPIGALRDGTVTPPQVSLDIPSSEDEAAVGAVANGGNFATAFVPSHAQTKLWPNKDK